ERACDDLRLQLDGSSGLGGPTRENEQDVGPPRPDLQGAILAWHAAHPAERLIGRAKYSKPESIQWDDETYRGDAYACYSWATYAAEVEVDLRTYGVRVTDFVALQEVGKVIHPMLARGQIAGGVVQGIGWALMEEVVLQDGAMK